MSQMSLNVAIRMPAPRLREADEATLRRGTGLRYTPLHADPRLSRPASKGERDEKQFSPIRLAGR